MYLYDAMGKIKKEIVAKPVPEQKNKVPALKKKKSGDKKGVDDWNRKFGYIFPQSVKCMAESIGIATLSDEVASNLAEDVSYRLRSVVQLCAKYLKHTRHRRLTCEDLNEVLRMCDVPSVLGHSIRSAPHNFIQLREPTIYLLDDPIIDLATHALNEIYVPAKSSMTVTGKWVIPDEQKAKPKIEELKTEPSDTANNKTLNYVTNSFVKTEDGKVGESNNPDYLESEPRIATDLIKYYGITCNSILGHCDLKVVLRDLSRNGKIVPVVPYLLNFITIALNKLGSERQLFRLLYAIDALTENTEIDFTPYHPVIRVSNALQKVIKAVNADKKPFSHLSTASDRMAFDRKPLLNNQHVLRCKAAQVLGKVIERWCRSEIQRSTIVDEMGKIIQDLKLPAGIHIGALALLTALGPAALGTGFWPLLELFLDHLHRVNILDRAALELVALNAAEILYRNPTFDEQRIPPPPHIDKLLYEYFGDAICYRRLHLTENPQFLRRFVESSSSAMDLKPDAKLKRPWRLPKCKNSMYNPEAKRPTIHTAFQLPKVRRKRNPRIIFKFAGANPVPEMSLRRRRLDSRYSQFIAGKVSEGHVVLVGKLWRRLKPKPINTASLFSVL